MRVRSSCWIGGVRACHRSAPSRPPFVLMLWTHPLALDELIASSANDGSPPSMARSRSRILDRWSAPHRRPHGYFTLRTTERHHGPSADRARTRSAPRSTLVRPQRVCPHRRVHAAQDRNKAPEQKTPWGRLARAYARYVQAISASDSRARSSAGSEVPASPRGPAKNTLALVAVGSPAIRRR